MKLLLILVLSSLYHSHIPNVVDIRRNIYEGYPQLQNIPLVEEDYDHRNEDVDLKLEQSKNSHDYMKMTNMKMKGKRLKSRQSQREVRIDGLHK